MDINKKILQALPYGPDFCFVDSIESVTENEIIGKYTFRKASAFYGSHFKNKPLVPGVLMVESMGQIGMVSHLIFLTKDFEFNFMPVLSNIETEFFDNANYEEELTVTGKKIYFRHNILKSSVEMRKSDKSLIAILTANIKIIEGK